MKGIISIWEHLWAKTDFNAGAGRRGKRIKHADSFAELKGRQTSGANLTYCLARNPSCSENDHS